MKKSQKNYSQNEERNIIALSTQKGGVVAVVDCDYPQYSIVEFFYKIICIWALQGCFAEFLCQ